MILSLWFFIFIVFFSCKPAAPEIFHKESLIKLGGAPQGVILYGLSEAAVEGRIDFAKPESLDFTVEAPLVLPAGFSLELGYSADVLPAGQRLVLRLYSGAESTGGIVDGPEAAWELPQNFISLAAADSAKKMIRYVVPVQLERIAHLSVALESPDGNLYAGSEGGAEGSVTINSLYLVPSWYGAAGEKTETFTPFVSFTEGSFTVNPPQAYRFTRASLNVTGLERSAAVETGSLRFDYVPPPDMLGKFSLPVEVLPDAAANLYPLVIHTYQEAESGNFTAPFSFSVTPVQFGGAGFSAQNNSIITPITVDPGLILDYPRNKWRQMSFELFRWDIFPSILIFDTADYDVQDRMLKRLAFFVEKAGFRGRLAPDREIAALHGWNAHDYRAGDLARFFDLARSENFPLLPEEIALEDILTANGIIHRSASGEISEGEGAIISISRESPDYLRRRFLVHENFHGLFFIDEDFRQFSRARYENLSPAARRFLVSYFEYSGYDSADTYLMINEFQAYVLQQAAAQAAAYFGENLAGTLYRHPWRFNALPEKDSRRDYWPEIAAAFTREAEAFSAYVNRRWGLTAGRVWHITRTENP
ncbi:hypothetical protein FACS1894151_08050 [Spirochaetia bacterium]|nr:hypothetical protein FACS1894151_08050 [Spirochaetia bacterium]